MRAAALTTTNQDEKSKVGTWKNPPTGFLSERIKTHAVILQKEWALCSHGDIRFMSDTDICVAAKRTCWSRDGCRVEVRRAELRRSICSVARTPRHPPRIPCEMSSGPLRRHSYTSQFHSWKQRLAITHFRCATPPPPFSERPTVRSWPNTANIWPSEAHTVLWDVGGSEHLRTGLKAAQPASSASTLNHLRETAHVFASNLFLYVRILFFKWKPLQTVSGDKYPP